MGGDPWAQDPVGMHLPGYRDRYYEVGLPCLSRDEGGCGFNHCEREADGGRPLGAGPCGNPPARLQGPLL
jgi:hypothetical protein